jgi:hypothetical protein
MRRAAPWFLIALFVMSGTLALGASDSSLYPMKQVSGFVSIPTTWYVNNTTGSDTNAGNSPTAPFQNITHAMTVALSGDTIMVAPGSYVPPC